MFAPEILDCLHRKQWVLFQYFTLGDMKQMISIEISITTTIEFFKAGIMIQVLTKIQR